jgi:ankyrin repeat protein
MANVRRGRIIFCCVLCSTLVCGWWINRLLRQSALNGALIARVKQGDATQVIDLLHRGADPDAREVPPDRRPLWQILVSQLARPTQTRSPSPPTALQVALRPVYNHLPYLVMEFPPDHMSIVKALLEHGAHANVIDQEAHSPLYYAMWYHYWDTAELLLKHGAHSNSRDAEDLTPLMNASQLGCGKRMVASLVKYGAMVNARNKDGATPLMLAAAAGSTGAIEGLLSKGAAIDLQDNAGKSAVMYGVAGTRPQVVQILLQHHPNLRLRDKQGKTALMQSPIVSDYREDIVLALKKAGCPR